MKVMGCLCLMGPAATLQSADWRGCFPKWVLPRSKSMYFSDLQKWKCCGTEFDINYIACSLLLSKMGAATLYINVLFRFAKRIRSHCKMYHYKVQIGEGAVQNGCSYSVFQWKCVGTEFDIKYIACSLLVSKMGAASLYLNGSTVEQSLISTGMLGLMGGKLSNSMGPVQLQIGVAIV